MSFAWFEYVSKRYLRQQKDCKKIKIIYLTEMNAQKLPIVIRLSEGEKATFKRAAVKAGLNLTAWIRTRLRAAAETELPAKEVNFE